MSIFHLPRETSSPQLHRDDTTVGIGKRHVFTSLPSPQLPPILFSQFMAMLPLWSLSLGYFVLQSRLASNSGSSCSSAYHLLPVSSRIPTLGDSQLLIKIDQSSFLPLSLFPFLFSLLLFFHLPFVFANYLLKFKHSSRSDTPSSLFRMETYNLMLHNATNCFTPWDTQVYIM